MTTGFATLIERGAALVSCALLCASCTSIGHLDANVQGPDDGHAYFVIGVQPQNMSAPF